MRAPSAAAEASTAVGTAPAESSTGATGGAAVKPAVGSGKAAASRLESAGPICNRRRDGYSSASVHDVFGHGEALQFGIKTQGNALDSGQITPAQSVSHHVPFHVRSAD